MRRGGVFLPSFTRLSRPYLPAERQCAPRAHCGDASIDARVVVLHDRTRVERDGAILENCQCPALARRQLLYTITSAATATLQYAP